MMSLVPSLPGHGNKAWWNLMLVAVDKNELMACCFGGLAVQTWFQFTDIWLATDLSCFLENSVRTYSVIIFYIGLFCHCQDADLDSDTYIFPPSGLLGYNIVQFDLLDWKGFWFKFIERSSQLRVYPNRPQDSQCCCATLHDGIKIGSQIFDGIYGWFVMGKLWLDQFLVRLASCIFQASNS